MKCVIPYFETRFTTDRPEHLLLIALFASVLSVTEAIPNLHTVILSLLSLIVLLYMLPRLHPASLPEYFGVSALGALSALLVSWQGALPSTGGLVLNRIALLSDLKLLQQKLEALADPNIIDLLLFCWVACCGLILCRRLHQRATGESKFQVQLRRGCFLAVGILGGLHFWLFQQPDLGPLVCPPSLRLEEAPHSRGPLFGSPQVSELLPKGRPFLETPLFLSWSPEQRYLVFQAATRKLTEPGYQPSKEELFLLYNLTSCLKYEVPATEQSTEYSAALLAFARHHNREYLFGEELSYFWCHGLRHLAKQKLGPNEMEKWQEYSRALRLTEQTEICSVRRRDNWTCSIGGMTVYGREVSTTPAHLYLETRIRWSNLLRDTPSWEKDIRQLQPESNALDDVLWAKEGRLSRHGGRSRTLEIRGVSPYGVRPHLSLSVYRQAPTMKQSGENSLPSTLCRCGGAEAPQP